MSLIRRRRAKEPNSLWMEAVEGVRLPYDKDLAMERAIAGLADLGEPSKLRRGCRCGDDLRNACSSCRPSPPDHEAFCGVHFGSVSCTCGLALGGATAE